MAEAERSDDWRRVSRLRLSQRSEGGGRCKEDGEQMLRSSHVISDASRKRSCADANQ